MTGSKDADLMNLPSPGVLHRATLQLLLIPLLVYIAWLMEIFLLEGNLTLFRTLDPFSFILYTLVGCILIGTVVPVFLVQRSFLSGAVNMFQVGFRSRRRTVVVCTVTGIACAIMVLLFSPPGPGRVAFFEVYLLYLPTCIASVMICWVLIGTHLQALVRSGGMLVAIPTGVVITSILFGITSVAHTPAAGPEDPLVRMILLGIVTAL